MTNEEVKKLIGENGSQSAAVLMDLLNRIEALEAGGGGSVAGENGCVLVADGNGGIKAERSVRAASRDLSVERFVSCNGVMATNLVSCRIVQTTGSIVIGNEEHTGEGLHLWSANGTEYSVTIDNSGQLVIEQVQ